MEWAESFDLEVLLWWAALSSVSAVNVAFAVRKYTRLQPSALSTLGVIYTAVCAFRSVFPRIDVERTCLFATPLSYISIGRSAATLAEVSLGLQLTLVCKDMARWAIFATTHTKGSAVPLHVRFFDKLLAPAPVWLAIIGNTFCWLAVLSKNQLLHAFESATWLLIGATLLLSLASLLIVHRATDEKTRGQGPSLLLLTVGFVGTAVFVGFMIAVDLPMYLHKHALDRAENKVFLGFREGVIDTFRCNVDRSFAFWGKEMPWLSGYFTVAVWMSIRLMQSPVSLKASPAKKSQ
eukprot:m.118824 g.118824  ORF g.118824 m.118824 type:complete len:293 (-) comp52023_c0_seq2:65-943(-)